MDAMTQVLAQSTIGDVIRRARKNAGMEQLELAEKIGVSRPLISKWENGKSVPDILQLRQLAESTGADWLLDLRNLPSTWLSELAGRAA